MKKCESCGREYPDFWLKCPACLKTLGQPPEPARPPGKPSAWLIPLALGLVGAGIGFLIVSRRSPHLLLLANMVWSLVFLASLIWVGMDSDRRDWTQAGRFAPDRPWMWILAMVLFWPLVFPFYTIARRWAPLRSPQPREL